MRWGIVGYGWVARDYMVPGIVAAGGQVAAFADPLPLASAAAGNRPCFTCIEEMLDKQPLDAIYVATPNDRHRAPVEAAAMAGIAVLCEKPMAASLDDAEAMAQTVEAHSTLFGTAFDQRRHPAHAAARDAIAMGLIGTPTAIRIVYSCWVGPDWCPDNWRADAHAAGGGAGIDLALHGLDLVDFLVGEPVIELSAMLQHRVHDYTVDDGAMLLGRTASDVLVSLHVAYNCPEALPRRRLEIIGSTGLIEASDTMGQTAGGTLVRRCGNTGLIAPIAFDASLSPFTAQAAAFEAAVKGDPHDYDIARDLRLMRLFDAAYRAARPCR